MAVSDTRFAAKTTSFAPLTAVAKAFSPHRHARPSFKFGSVVIASYEFPETHRLSGFRPSYSQPESPEASPT